VREWGDLSLNECWLKCNLDYNKCKAITYWHGDRSNLTSNGCFLYESTSLAKYKDKEDQFTSITRLNVSFYNIYIRFHLTSIPKL
jgi:hypothetical protein